MKDATIVAPLDWTVGQPLFPQVIFAPAAALELQYEAAPCWM